MRTEPVELSGFQHTQATFVDDRFPYMITHEQTTPLEDRQGNQSIAPIGLEEA